MKKISVSVCILVLCSLFSVVPLHAQTLKITELAVTTKVSKGKPIDRIHRISHRSVKLLHCFSRTLLDDAAEASITHVWLREGQIVQETALPVKARRWRAYSSLPVSLASIGNWRVEVRDATGTVLKSAAFKVN